MRALSLLHSLAAVSLLTLADAVDVAPGPAANLAMNRLARRTTVGRSTLDTDPSALYPTHTLSVPVDHFHNESKYEPHSSKTFELRYWFDASYWEEGGPVIVLQSGETSGENRLSYLQKGILAQLANATHGIGVVLEHRYYGQSIPTSDLSVENLRFLTTEQALADEAYFAQHVVFPGLEKHNLTSHTTPYIGYGGSYAGAFNAFLRVVYPDVFWGTISSSGVVEAVVDYWQYWSPIGDYAGQDCVDAVKKITNIGDVILQGGNASDIALLKSTWGMPNVTDNRDFVSVLYEPWEYWQELNWDPALNDSTVQYFCNNVSASSVVFESTEMLKSDVHDLIQLGGYEDEADALTVPFLNYIGYINMSYVAPCARSGSSQESCFGPPSPAVYHLDGKSQTWRSWPWQCCTEWGYYASGSGTPADELSLISRLIDVPYLSQMCELAFNITTPPDTDLINQYGGYDISYDRLAFLDGQRDPWRPATVHASPYVAGVDNRTSTDAQPFILIENAVHHWDENGLFPNETTPTLPPAPVKDAQTSEAAFVQVWLEEWQATRARSRGA